MKNNIGGLKQNRQDDQGANTRLTSLSTQNQRDKLDNRKKLCFVLT